MFIQGLFEGVINGAILALIAMGVALVWGVMNILSFSQGEFLMLGMFVTYYVNLYLGLDPIFALPISTLALFLLGLVIYRTVISKAIKGPKLSQRLITFALSMVLINSALLFFGAEFKTVPHVGVQGSIDLGWLIIAKQKLVPFFIAISVAGGMFAFLQYTRVGKAIQATAMDKRAASLVGIDTEKIYAYAFGLASAVAGAAGCALTYYYYLYPSVGANFQLWGFVAVAMGGFGSVVGAFISGLVMGIADTLTGLYVNTAIKYIGVCLVFLITVTFRPKGIFGR
ncbi:MAG: branched-chain amino acid ABC transporter permease [Anaerolineaceae bacterium]|nr:branched-chain amino acid ABC transporter permease [Anaerolineaceae bacterium]